MPKRLTLQQLDHVFKSDPARAIDIVRRRAQRRLDSPEPSDQLVGELKNWAVDQARARLRRNQA